MRCKNEYAEPRARQGHSQGVRKPVPKRSKEQPKENDDQE